MPRERGFDLTTALEQAMNAFWDKGYAATSAQDLVDGTGLGRGSLYNTFESKQKLFHAALRHYDDRWTAAQEAVLGGDGPVRERLRTILMTVVDEETGQSLHRGCLAVNSAIELAGLDPQVDELVRSVFSRMEVALHDAIRRARDDGEVAADTDPGALARSLLTTMYGLRVLGKTAPREELVGVVDTALNAIH